MAGIIADELVTVLSYAAKTKPLVDAEKSVAGVDKANKAAAASTDKLTAKMDGLADQLQSTSDKALALKEQQLRLQRQISATGKPTAEQSKELHRLKMELEDNAIHAKKLSASQKELQRELKATREESKRLGAETKQLAAAEKQAAAARSSAEKATARDQAKTARETEKAQTAASRSAAKAQTAADRAQTKRASIEARGMKDDELARYVGVAGPQGKVAEEELLKRRMDAKKIEHSADARRQTAGGAARSGLASKSGINLQGMTGGAVAVVAAAAAVVALGAGMASLGSKVSEVSTRFQSLKASLVTVTGSAEGADKQFAAIKDFAATTPYQVDAATEAFIKLKALGLDASTASLTSYGNTASAMGKDLNQMIEAIADATTGEFERLKEFGIKSKSVGDNVEFTFRGVTTTVKKNATEIEGYLKQIGDTQFAGAMTRQMDTIGGVLSNLGDRFDSFLLKIGEGGQMDTMKRVFEDVAKLMTDDLAGALGDLQAEGAGIIEDLIGHVDPKDLEGIVWIFEQLVIVVRLALKPMSLLIEMVVAVLGAIGRLGELIQDTFLALFRDVEKLVSESFLGGLADTIRDAASATLDFADNALDSLVSVMHEAVPATQELGYAWDSVATALTGVKDGASSAQTALLELVSGAVQKKIQALGNQLELKGKAMVQGATEAHLQQWRAGGGALGKVADEEILRRKQSEIAGRTEELYQEGGGDKFKPEGLAEATKAIDDQASERGDSVYEAARANDVGVSEAKRMATIAAGEEKRRLLAAYDATGKAPKGGKKKKGGGKSPAKEGLEKLVLSRVDSLSEEAGEREGARLISAGTEKTGMTTEQALAAGQDKRAKVRDKLLNDFYSTGKLPPGVRSDLQRMAQIPSVEDQIGNIAPPVISVTNIKVDARVNTMNVGERSTFSGTARENATEIKELIDTQLAEHLRLAITDVTQGELP